MKVLQELENVDDDADQLGIAFVKINDAELADEYSLGALPALVYYRRRIPVVYDGELRGRWLIIFFLCVWGMLVAGLSLLFF